MTHIAMAPLQDGRAVDWLEQVTDAQYQGVSKTRANMVGTPGSPQYGPKSFVSALLTNQANL